MKRGFHSVSLEDIAEEAGVSRQAVYKSHFASKAELLLELVRYLHVAENLDQLTAPFYASQAGVEKLHEAIRTIVLIEGRIHDIALALAAAATSDEAAAAALNDRVEVKRGAVREALELVKHDGCLSPAWPLEEAVDMVTALLSIDTYELLVVQRGWPPERLIQRIHQLSAAVVTRPRG